MDAVSHVLAGRRGGTAGLDRMVGYSVAAHVVLLAVVTLVPSGWLGAQAVEEPATVMTISLGGPVGPRNGGMTPMGGRPVQVAQPPQAKPAVEPVRPPAAKAPEMVEPTKTAPKPPAAPVKTTVPEARNRTPIRGEEVRKGSAVAETGGRGQGFGLTQGGGGTGAQINVGNFCCPEYITTMAELINRNWDSKQLVAGSTIMKFTIARDGTIGNIALARSSGQPSLDYLSERALAATKLPPLPAAYPNPSLTVQVTFDYLR